MAKARRSELQSGAVVAVPEKWGDSLIFHLSDFMKPRSKGGSLLTAGWLRKIVVREHMFNQR